MNTHTKVYFCHMPMSKQRAQDSRQASCELADPGSGSGAPGTGVEAAPDGHWAQTCPVSAGSVCVPDKHRSSPPRTRPHSADKAARWPLPRWPSWGGVQSVGFLLWTGSGTAGQSVSRPVGNPLLLHKDYYAFADKQTKSRRKGGGGGRSGGRGGSGVAELEANGSKHGTRWSMVNGRGGKMLLKAMNGEWEG